jgi:sigma-B regulation protein RsbU (phosphoserine phosphatase)
MNPAPSLPPSSADATGTNTRTATLDVAEHHTNTRTVVAPGFSAAPEVVKVRGPKLEQLLALSVGALIMVVVVTLAGVYAYATTAQFRDIAATQGERIQEQARELGTTVSHTLSLTSASALRDSNFAFLGEVARNIIAKNPNVLQVQIFDPEGLSIADSDPTAELGVQSDRVTERSWRITAFNGKPAFEYQEPIDYGSRSGSGVVVLTYSLEPLQKELRLLEKARNEAVRSSVTRSLGVGAGLLLLGGVLAAILSRRITRPLGTLTQRAMDLAGGNLDARVQPPRGTGREVKALGLVFNHMAERMSYLVEDARVKAVLEREMALARQVQEALLPPRHVWDANGIRVSGAVVTADACGGDWWFRAALDDGRVVMGIGDVTGHGLAPALVATSAAAGFAAAIRLAHAAEVNAQMLITSLNQTMHLVGKGEHQMSCALAVFDLTKNEVDFASGGHPSALVVNRATGEVRSLLSRGTLLGAAANTTYSSRQAPLKPGDVLVWHTDGVTESENTSRAQYGTQRLLATVKTNIQLPPDRLRDAIMMDVRLHMGTQPQADDITLVVAEYQPAA